MIKKPPPGGAPLPTPVNPFPMVPAPLPIPNSPYGTTPGGLGSNSNYFLFSPSEVTDGCSNLRGLSVTIDVHEEIVGSNGFSFQLNAYSRKTYPLTNPPIETHLLAQQYVIAINPKSFGNAPEISWSIDNGPISKTKNNILIGDKFAKLRDYTLPAGYKLTIILADDPGSGNIIGANFTATDDTGTRSASGPISLIKQAPNLAPVVAFQMNLVGPGFGEATLLSSGAGAMTYSSANEMLAVSNTLPNCAPFHYITDEKANSLYGELTSRMSRTFVQTFKADLFAIRPESG